MADVIVMSDASDEAVDGRSVLSAEGRSAVRVTAVIPFLNAMRYLPVTAPSVIAAAHHSGDVEVVYVDNGSTDGSVEYLRSLGASCVRVVCVSGKTIAGTRNWGARQGTGTYLSFLDADCGVDIDYFDVASTTLRNTRAAATGCEYDLRPKPNWIETVLKDLHYVGRDRYVRYINAGNFFIAREAFDAVDGFQEQLSTDEDSDIGRRLTEAGFRLYECTSVKAIHYGNPESLRAHYRRTVWHSMGMFASLRHGSIDRPTAMLGLHLLATVAGVALIVAGRGHLIVRTGAAMFLQALVPGATAAYRMFQTRRATRLHHAVLVYWVYYWARLHALMLIAIGRGGDYRK